VDQPAVGNARHENLTRTGEFAVIRTMQYPGDVSVALN